MTRIPGDSASAPRCDRIASLLGQASWLIDHPSHALLLFPPVWLVVGGISGRWLAAGLCAWAPTLLAIALWLERPWLERLPFPPITVLTLVGALRWGLGAGLLAVAGPGDLPGDVIVWWRELEPSQLLWASVSTAIVLAGLLMNRRLLQRQQPGPLSAAMLQMLPTLTLILGLFSFGYILIGVTSGTLDRGSSNYIYWVTRLWRADTLFVPFIRLKDLFFLLLPLSLQQCLDQRHGRPSMFASWLQCIVLTGLAFASISLGALTGGRGLVLAPLAMLLAGLWLTDLRPKLLRWFFLTLLALALAFIPIMAQIRDSSEFKASNIQDLDQRITVLMNSATALRAGTGKLAVTGRDLFPASDPYLFQTPGSDQQPAGWRGLNGLLFLYVPKHLYPQRPEINDGHLIAKEVMGTPNAGTFNGIHTWFPNLSFGGDLYRRFRWPGVLTGAALFGLFYAAMSRLWYAYSSLDQSLFRFMIAMYPATFFNGVPLRSVSETAWNWCWDFPKYLLVLLLLSWVLERLQKRSGTL